MKRLLSVLVVFGVFLGSVGESLALPECPGSPSKSANGSDQWTNCFGTHAVGENGYKYVGEFKDGKFHGQGTEAFTNGDKYVGEFKGGVRHGQGKLNYADGRIEDGIFENDKFKYAQKVTPTVTAEKSPPPKRV